MIKCKSKILVYGAILIFILINGSISLAATNDKTYYTYNTDQSIVYVERIVRPNENVTCLLLKPEADITDGVQENEIANLAQKKADSDGLVLFKLPVKNVNDGDTFTVLSGSDYSEMTILSCTFNLSNNKIHYGDINNDDEINANDAVLLQNYLLEKCELTDIQLQCADADADGNISNKDVVNILRYSIAIDNNINDSWLK